MRANRWPIIYIYISLRKETIVNTDGFPYARRRRSPTSGAVNYFYISFSRIAFSPFLPSSPSAGILRIPRIIKVSSTNAGQRDYSNAKIPISKVIPILCIIDVLIIARNLYK